MIENIHVSGYSSGWESSAAYLAVDEIPEPIIFLQGPMID